MATVAVAAAGVAGGAILGSTLTAGAATPSSTVAATDSTSLPSGTSSAPPGYHVPGKSGTVTAVGTSTVTIKTSTGTTTYKVSSSSDIDKNGEATLSDLKVGDAVTFSVESGASTPTIDKLHAGNESLDRPAGPRGRPPSGGGPQGRPPSGA